MSKAFRCLVMSFFRYSGLSAWAFSPNNMNSNGNANVFNVNTNGNLDNNNVTNGGGVAPITC